MVSDKNLTMAVSSLVLKGEENDEHGTSVEQFIVNLREDYKDLEEFYHFVNSETRVLEVGKFILKQINDIVLLHRFEALNLQDKIDWRLAMRRMQQIHAAVLQDSESLDKVVKFLGTHHVPAPVLKDSEPGNGDDGFWARDLIKLCESIQQAHQVDWKDAAATIEKSTRGLKIFRFSAHPNASRSFDRHTISRACGHLRELREFLSHKVRLYICVSPKAHFWSVTSNAELIDELRITEDFVYQRILNPPLGPMMMQPSVSPPMGESAVLMNLKHDGIFNSLDDLIKIGESYLLAYERRAIGLSEQMGCGKNWRVAMERVRDLVAEPGEQAGEVQRSVSDALAFVRLHDMITVPDMVANTWKLVVGCNRECEKAVEVIRERGSFHVQSPALSMSSAQKAKILRNNCLPLTRVETLHKIIPGWHLQGYRMRRSRRDRSMFYSPCWNLGWTCYWDMILYQRGFFSTLEDRLAVTFVQMQNFACMIVWLKYHLGLMTAQHCVEYLIEKTGDDRENVQGIVKDVFDVPEVFDHGLGEAMGGLQFLQLRKEMVESGKMGEKEFHDRILRENQMPISLLRCLLNGEAPKICDDDEPWELDTV